MPETIDNYVLNMHIFMYKSKLFIQSTIHLILCLFLTSFIISYSYEILKFMYVVLVKDILKEYYELTTTNNMNYTFDCSHINNHNTMYNLAYEFKKSEGLI
jgi:hypothetical protein